MKKLTLLTAILLATTTFAQVPSYVPTNGLVGWWPFNGNANDESGNGNNGAVNGATLTTDRNGVANKAYSFDGITNFIEVNSSNSLNVSSQYTLSTWINVTQWSFLSPIDEHAVISKIDNGNWSGGYEIFIGGNNGTIAHTGNIGNSNFAMTSNNHNINNWYYVVVTYNGNTMKMYVNGILVNSQNYSGLLQTSSIPLRFGRRGGAGFYNNWFKGKIDDAGIWNRALTQCEIQDLYQSQISYSNIEAGSNQSICSGDHVTLIASGAVTYSWNNNVINAQAFTPIITQNYILTGTDSIGCVGTDTVEVIVLEPTSSSQTQTALDTYTWPVNNQTYTQSGTYSDTLMNAAGCDSIITLNLTLSFTGINELNASSLSISPNPTASDFTIAGLELYNNISSMRVSDVNGKLIKELDPRATKFTLGTVKSGVYFLTITAGDKQEVIKIIKE